MNDQTASAESVASAHDRYAYWTGEVSRQQGQLDGATQGANLALAAQKRTLDDLTGATVSTSKAEADFYDAVSRADGALTNLSGNVLDGAGSLDVQSEAGRRAQEVLFGVRDAGNRLIDTMVTQGATTDQVNAKDAQLRDSFIRTAQQMGISRDAAYRLADQIYGIPAQRQTQITADTTQATNAVAGLQAQIDGIRGRIVSITARTTMEDLNGSVSGSGRMGTAAAGGPIIGPGTGTSDSIPYMLSNGEHVWTAREVQAAGGQSAMLEMRKSILANGRGLAAGGPVGDVEVIVDMSQVAQAEANARRTLAAMVPALGMGFHGLFNTAKAAFPGVILTSGFRPGDPGWHGKGRAADLGWAGNDPRHLAQINEFFYDHYKSQLKELIYDGPGDNRPDIKDFQDHTYNAQTRADHETHVHTARENGGPFWAGQDFLVGERGPEIARFNAPGNIWPTGTAPSAMPGYGMGGGQQGGFSVEQLTASLTTALGRVVSELPTGPLVEMNGVSIGGQSDENSLARKLKYELATKGK
jgi:hypothetical protein